MNAKVILTSVLLLGALVPAVAMAATVPPAPNCDSSNPTYIPKQEIHHYGGAGTFGITINGAFGGAGAADVFDTSGCATGDGDNETGEGGAAFPLTSNGNCQAANGHHGTDVKVSSNVGGFDVSFTAGTDGQQAGVPDDATTGCTGNGVISDSYDTDPFDCGQGQAGDSSTNVDATVAANPNPHDGSATDPDPWATTYGAVAQGSVRSANGGECVAVDGNAWSFLSFGVVIVINNPPLIDTSGCPAPIGDGTGAPGSSTCGLHGSIGSVGISVPTSGDITASPYTA